MLDFVRIVQVTKNKRTYVMPEFLVMPSNDLMIRGGGFYAIWDEETQLWTTNEFRAFQLIDAELNRYLSEHPDLRETATPLFCNTATSGIADKWKHYVNVIMPDIYKDLDTRIVYQNTSRGKEDYVTQVLPYSLLPGDTSRWDELTDVLYDPEEKFKIEWCIGAIACGASMELQKFAVFYGDPGAGKSTILNIIQGMFSGYWRPFNSKQLGSRDASFALEPFKDNPMIAIDHDGDLSRLDDNTRLNTIVSHEPMIMNVKHKSMYSVVLKTFIMMATNREVKITDAKSGMLRRLIDIYPSKRLIPFSRYNWLMDGMKFEYGAIAAKCIDVFQSDPHYFDNYVPENMLSESNVFFMFVEDNFDLFREQDFTTLDQAWKLYLAFIENGKYEFRLNKTRFRAELKNYFDKFYEKKYLDNGKSYRSYYQGFLTKKFRYTPKEEAPEEVKNEDITITFGWLNFKKQQSKFDIMADTWPAQEANQKGFPKEKWLDVATTIRDIDTEKLHYVKVPMNHIIIDFDGDNLEENLEAASNFPPTYAELSRSGKRIHLHYIYDGDPEKLARSYGYKIEIKVYAGNAALRRMLTKCNDFDIAHISAGLPLKGDKTVLNTEVLANERHLRALIMKGLNKDVWPNTRPSIDYIKMILEKAYNQPDFVYDITDMRQAVLSFAAESTNQAEYCYNVAANLPYKSKALAEDPAPGGASNGTPVIYDIEVFPNLLVVCWKYLDGDTIVRMINPTPMEVEEFVQTYDLIGFNNKRYDNIILYARILGGDNLRLYKISQSIINSNTDKSDFEKDYMLNNNAKNLSYMDLWDLANGDHRMGLKKWEIKLHIHHRECPYNWDEPVPEDKWSEIADYCANDVLATEAVYHALLDNDIKSREILSTLADMPMNSSTNELTAKIIFGEEREPQSQFNWRDMSKPVNYVADEDIEFLMTHTSMNMTEPFVPYNGGPASILPYFPGYTFDNGKSYYRGELVGEGGFVYGEQGIYHNVVLLDVASMHPSSLVDEILFGITYTDRFYQLLQTRLHVKHGEFDIARQLFDGRMAPYLTNPEEAAALSQALKIPINMVYGVTAAKFANKFRDPNNIDNIVAKRGALFMIDLKNAVQERGFTVAHIKTDSIKIPDATPEIIQFVMDFGKKYGYTFEHEATYERMCLVNDAVYVARYADEDWCKNAYGYVPEKNHKKPGQWTMTGTQFQVPYVAKTLFTHEPIEFWDICETKSVSGGAAIYLDMNENLPDVSEAEKILKKRRKQRKDLLTSGEPIPPDLDLDIVDGEQQVAEGHNYIFVGAVGLFCPVLPGTGGGLATRIKDDSVGAVGGTKGYRWMEAETIKELGLEDIVDLSYYDSMVNEAIATIQEYGSFEDFITIDAA